MRDKIGYFVSILGGVSTLLTNSTLGLGDVGKITALLSFATSVFQNIAIGSDELKALDNQVKALVAEGRGPTDAEWKGWEDRAKAVDARFARLGAPPVE